MSDAPDRRDFEKWASDDGRFPQAVERAASGFYKLAQTESAWHVWRAAASTHCVQADRLRTLLREVSANRWECATEDGACPDCGADDGEPHDSGCLLGRVDAEIETAAPLRKAEDMSPNDLGLSHWPC